MKGKGDLSDKDWRKEIKWKTNAPSCNDKLVAF
jgi:hypothetical protein